MIFLFLLWTGWKTISLCLPLLVFNVKPVIGSGDLSVLNHPEATVATWLLLGSYGLAEPFICDQSAVFIVLGWVWS